MSLLLLVAAPAPTPPAITRGGGPCPGPLCEEAPSFRTGGPDLGVPLGWRRLRLEPSPFVDGGPPGLRVEGRLGIPKLPGPSSFASWGVGVEAPGSPFAKWKPLKTSYGVLVARVAYGLYLGKVSAPRGKLLLYGEYEQESVAARRGRAKLPGSKFGIEGTLMLTRYLGLHLDTRVGMHGFYSGLTLLLFP